MASSVQIWGSEGGKVLEATHVGSGGPHDDNHYNAGIYGSSQAPRERRMSPYAFNGGTSLGVAGKNFCVVAADTRLSQGYSILTRRGGIGHQLTSKCVVAAGGCRTDVASLQKLLDIRMQQYVDAHDKEMSTPAVAQLLSTTLYYRRFFPYYAFNVVGGLDKEGKGAVYTYDAIGSFERTEYAAQGSGQKLIIPILDNVVGNKNRSDPKKEWTVEEAVELVKDTFITAGEREIYVGDAVEIYIIQASGITMEVFQLKKD